MKPLINKTTFLNLEIDHPDPVVISMISDGLRGGNFEEMEIVCDDARTLEWLVENQGCQDEENVPSFPFYKKF